MLRLSAIAGLHATLDQQWRSPIADTVAARWGLPAGEARFWRSSASHVFLSSLGYLRFAPHPMRQDPAGCGHVASRHTDPVPDAVAHAAAPGQVTALEAALAAAGLPVAAPVPSLTGSHTETVPTALGVMTASLHLRAPGEPIDLDDLDLPRARRWGALLARFHATAAPVELPPAALTADPALAHLPRDATRFGLTHGDFELDNIAWNGDAPTVFDFDEAGLSWFAADIAFALRDLTAGTGHPSPPHRSRYDAFLSGYRTVRPFAEEALLPLFSRRLAAQAAARVCACLDSTDLPELRQRLETFIARQTQIACGA